MTASIDQQSQPDSQAYVLRLWRDSHHGRWLFSLQDVDSKTRYGFGSREEMCSFLDQQMQDGSNSKWPSEPHAE